MVRWKEKRKKIIGCVLFCMLSFASFGQKETYINPGLLSASATLSPAIMLNRKEVNYYISGFFEGKITKHFSIRGDGYYLLGNAPTKFLKNKISAFIGFQYGYPFGNLELYTGLAPGFTYMQSNVNTANKEFNPSVQLNAGVRYYVWKYFHFTANFLYTHAQMHNLDRVNGMADELVFSVGLGFNFQALKKYRNPESN
ncbi:MAG TPA: outer membrane beta-barrel protein [Taishania sp.]|nr:outer membrane beta-barrel protein [Taishania sp.]